MGAKAWLDDNDFHSVHVDRMCCGDPGDCECDVPHLSDPRPPKRIKASRLEWERIRRAKMGHSCRVCGEGFGTELHHLVPRSQRGDDVPSNLVELCHLCHGLIEARDTTASMRLGLMLAPDEIRYVLRKKGAYYLAERYRLAFTDDEARELAA